MFNSGKVTTEFDDSVVKVDEVAKVIRLSGY
ncbi:hypothetical protein [Pseudogracilibacillus sp. SO30301A]